MHLVIIFASSTSLASIVLLLIHLPNVVLSSSVHVKTSALGNNKYADCNLKTLSLIYATKH